MMCRFLAYAGPSRVELSALIERPENSLINQGKCPRLCRGVSDDGCGLAWYTENDAHPQLYKSALPAWEDADFQSLIRQTSSSWFLGHVRAATVGNVSLNNSHPFVFENYSFVHNGTIREVDRFRGAWLSELDEDLSASIKGQTDSELLFHLILQEIRRGKSFSIAVLAVFEKIKAAQATLDEGVHSYLNIALTDGRQLIATRYATKNAGSPSLFYSHSPAISGVENGVIISSEQLTEGSPEWVELQNGEMMMVNADLSFQRALFA